MRWAEWPNRESLSKNTTHTQCLFDTAKSGVEWVYFVLESSLPVVLRVTKYVKCANLYPGVVVLYFK